MISFYSIILACFSVYKYHLTLGYHFLHQAFPDALFHQLLLAMAHPDHETRVGAHHVFSIVLMPSLICAWLPCNGEPLLARPVFSPNTSRRINSGSFSIQNENNDKSESAEGVLVEEVNQVLDNGVAQSIKCRSRDQSHSFKHAMVNGKAVHHNSSLDNSNILFVLCSTKIIIIFLVVYFKCFIYLNFSRI